MSKIQVSKNHEILILCLNPNCTFSQQRCLDSRSIRTHPSDCSRHYFSADVITETHWNKIPDYPSDLLGSSIKKKIDKQLSVENQGYMPYFKRILNYFKVKFQNCLEIFSKKFEEMYPSSSLQDLFNQTYSLQAISGYLKQGSNPDFITKCINANFSNDHYGFLGKMNEKLNLISQNLDNLLNNLKNHLKKLIQGINNQKQAESLTYRFDQSKMKPKIEMGLNKSKFISSSKIECSNGKIIFPKLDNIASFLPWVYSDKGFTTGIHELRITSLKFPLVSNSGLAILQQHDIDTYPYHIFKSLFNREGKGFRLLKGQQVQFTNDKNSKINKPYYNQIETVIGSISEVVLRLQLNANPRAILRDSERTSMYICELEKNKQYRFGIYGSGWTISVSELW